MPIIVDEFIARQKNPLLVTIIENMHKKCQKCIEIRRFIVAFSSAVLIAVVGEQLDLSNEMIMWTSALGGIGVLGLFGVLGRQKK